MAPIRWNGPNASLIIMMCLCSDVDHESAGGCDLL